MDNSLTNLIVGIILVFLTLYFLFNSILLGIGMLVVDFFFIRGLIRD